MAKITDLDFVVLWRIEQVIGIVLVQDAQTTPTPVATSVFYSPKNKTSIKNVDELISTLQARLKRAVIYDPAYEYDSAAVPVIMEGIVYWLSIHFKSWVHLSTIESSEWLLTPVP